MSCGHLCGCSNCERQLDLLPLSLLKQLSSLHLSNVAVGGNLDLFRPMHLVSLQMLGGSVVDVVALKKMIRALLEAGQLQRLVLAIPGGFRTLKSVSGQQGSLLTSLLLSFPTDVAPDLTPGLLGGLKVLALLGANEPLRPQITALVHLEALSLAQCHECDAQMLSALTALRQAPKCASLHICPAMVHRA